MTKQLLSKSTIIEYAIRFVYWKQLYLSVEHKCCKNKHI